MSHLHSHSHSHPAKEWGRQGRRRRGRETRQHGLTAPVHADWHQGWSGQCPDRWRDHQGRDLRARFRTCWSVCVSYRVVSCRARVMLAMSCRVLLGYDVSCSSVVSVGRLLVLVVIYAVALQSAVCKSRKKAVWLTESATLARALRLWRLSDLRVLYYFARVLKSKGADG